MPIRILLAMLAFTSAWSASTEPNPGPAWAVYIPLGATDGAGVGDPGKKCHLYTKTDANGTVVGQAWHTYLVLKDGVPITNNSDPAIWNGTAVLYLEPRPANPSELALKVSGADLNPSHGYAVLRMVQIRPGDDFMPANPAILGSPASERGRRNHETIWQNNVPGVYWMAAEETPQIFWSQVIDANNAALLTTRLNTFLASDGLAGRSSEFVSGLLPLIYTTWSEAWDFCDRLSTLTGARVRLPNEAEWEYACRAGQQAAFNTERGYTLTGPQWEITDGSAPNPKKLSPGDYDAYFQKGPITVNGPNTLAMGSVFYNGAWTTVISTISATANGSIAPQQNFGALAEVEANFDSRFRRWYTRVYAFGWTTFNARSAYFQVNPALITDSTTVPAVVIEADEFNGTRDTTLSGMYASDDLHLARLVRGLFVAIDATGSYTALTTNIAGFRQVIDGVMPPGMAKPTGALVYYHEAEFDDNGVFRGSPLPDEDDFFTDPNQDIMNSIAGLPLNGSTLDSDMKDAMNTAITTAKANPTFAAVNWGEGYSQYTYTATVSLAGLIDKRGRYALRNRWGLANMHGNLAEWCVPIAAAKRRWRWNGSSDALDSSGYFDQTGPASASHPYVVIRGGSFQASADKCRSAARAPAIPEDRGLGATSGRPHIGFRLLIEAP